MLNLRHAILPVCCYALLPLVNLLHPVEVLEPGRTMEEYW